MATDRRLRRTQRALGDAPQDAAAWLRAAHDLERAGQHLRAQRAAVHAAGLQRDDAHLIATLRELGVFGVWPRERGGTANQRRAQVLGPRQGTLAWRRDLPRRPTGTPRVDLSGRPVLRARTAGLLRVSLDGHQVTALGDWPAEVPPTLGADGPCAIDAARLELRGPGELPLDVRLAPFLATPGWRYVALPSGVLAQGPDTLPLWRAALPAPLDLAAADDGPLYVSLADGRVLALDRANGQPRWELPPTRGQVSLAVADDGALVARRGRRLLCVEPGGDQRWSLELRGASDPALDDTRAVISSTVSGTRCLDLQSGAQRWHLPELRSEQAPALDREGWAFLAVPWGGLVALDPAGEVQFQARLGGAGPPSAPALGWDGRAYVTAGPSLVAVT